MRHVSVTSLSQRYGHIFLLGMILRADKILSNESMRLKRVLYLRARVCSTVSQYDTIISNPPGLRGQYFQ